MADVLIVAEAAGEELLPTTLELATQGRRVADELGGSLVALLAGLNVQGVASGLGEYGVDRVLLASADGPQPPSTAWLVGAAEAAARQVNPAAILLIHSPMGREVGPMLAFRLGSAAITNCTRLRVDGGQLVATKPIFGGSVLSDLSVTTTPAVITLRPRAFEAAPPRPEASAQVEALSVPAADGRMEVLEEVRAQANEGPSLKDARIVVSGGRGIGGPENWQQLDELAQVLGAAVGASRAVTDAGWVTPAHQVGLTGATIAPDLYITVGISGAVQHIAGITGAKNVVAINKDGEANIFKYARFGVVGDWKQVLPAFTERLKQLRS